MPERSYRQIVLLVTAMSVISFIALFLIRSLGVLEPVELRLYDTTASFWASDLPVEDVIIISIDEHDIVDWGWPLSDLRLAEIITSLGNAGALAIGVDIYRDHGIGPGAAELTDALSTYAAVAITKLDTDTTPAISPPEAVRQSGRYGFSDMPLDADGTVRRALLLVNDENGVQLSFALRLVQVALGNTPLAASPQDPSTLTFDGYPVPALRNGFGPYVNLDDAGYQLLIEYKNRLPIARQILARDILSGKFASDAIKGKIVIVGNTTDSVKDYFRTPLNLGVEPIQTFGIQLHAAIVQQILQYANGAQTPVRSLPASAQTALILAFSVIGALAALRARNVVSAVLFGPVLGTLFGAAMIAAFAKGLWLPSIPAVFEYLLSFFLIYFALATIARKEQKQVFQLFSSHLSPQLTQQIWDNRKRILSGGKLIPQRLFATVLFADLVGSTKVGGAAEPAAYMDWIESYLATMSAVAQVEGGFVEKYTGDGIMVVFGAPMPSLSGDDRRRDAEAACSCAVAMSEAIDRLNGADNLLAAYRTRIGLHSGFVFGGTIGTAGSLRYNVIGDSANVASRVEAFGKRIQDRTKQSTTICLTHQTVKLARQAISVVPIGTLAHDDAKTELEVFQLTGLVIG